MSPFIVPVFLVTYRPPPNAATGCACVGVPPNCTFAGCPKSLCCNRWYPQCTYHTRDTASTDAVISGREADRGRGTMAPSPGLVSVPSLCARFGQLNRDRGGYLIDQATTSVGCRLLRRPFSQVVGCVAAGRWVGTVQGLQHPMHGLAWAPVKAPILALPKIVATCRPSIFRPRCLHTALVKAWSSGPASYRLFCYLLPTVPQHISLPTHTLARSSPLLSSSSIHPFTFFFSPHLPSLLLGLC